LRRGDAQPDHAMVLHLAITMALTLEEVDEMLRMPG
jgi:hypothetical protein